MSLTAYIIIAVAIALLVLGRGCIACGIARCVSGIGKLGKRFLKG